MYIVGKGFPKPINRQRVSGVHPTAKSGRPMMAHGHFDASVSSLVAPESGAAAPEEVVSPDIVGKRCGRRNLQS